MSRQERAAQNSTGGDQSLERPGASGATGASNSKEVENIRHFYNNVYYARSQGAEEEYRTHYQRLFTKVGIHRGDRVLDVACGTGDWLQTCARNGCQVSGVDLSDKAVEICRSRIPAGEFYAQPAETLPFPDQHFDTISCLGSIALLYNITCPVTGLLWRGGNRSRPARRLLWGKVPLLS